MNPNCPPFVPKLSLSHTELSSSADLKKSMKAENGQNEDSYSLNESLIAEQIKLQKGKLNSALPSHINKELTLCRCMIPQRLAET